MTSQSEDPDQHVDGGDELSLKKRLDREVNEQLEAALSDFDPTALEAASSEETLGDDSPASSESAVHIGRVVAVRGDDVFVDLGGKSEGMLPVHQFEDEPLPEPGSNVEVIVDRFDEEEGVVRLRRKWAAVEANWDNLQEGVIVEGRVTGVNQGGLEVDVGGVRGFIPASLVDLVRVPDLNELSGERLRCLVLEADARKRNLVLSRRALLERQREEARKKTWAELAESQVRTGTVKSIQPFGAFVDLGGVDGLLHVSQMSWARVEDPADVVHPGQQIQVQVLKVDRDKQRVSLGLKQLQSSPWQDAGQRWAVGSLVAGRVTRLAPFGAFVELEPGVEGLIHISEVSPQRIRQVRDVLSEGQEVNVRILGVDTGRHRISLSLKQAAEQLKPEVDEPASEEGQTSSPSNQSGPLAGGLERLDR